MTVAIVEVDIAVAAEGMRASRLISAGVENDLGEHIGTIDELMIVADRVEFVILSVGGFLGIGAHLVAVNFEDLQIDENGILLPGASRDELKRLAKFEYDEGADR
ncbi:MAG: hypothetical protein JWN69_890 [Alphaproteobacteria bacterium]|nr:hypothetical protein [Alphaproteobacteria bacterium]